MTVTAADYLARVGLLASAHASLEELVTAHLRAVPFENLDLHLGDPIRLDVERILDKIVCRRRGGFCYELNGAFAWLLGELGYDVDLLGARVSVPGGYTSPFDHMTVRVRREGAPWLADVGFGTFAAAPFRLDTEAEQPDPNGVVRVIVSPDGDLDISLGGVPQLRVETRRRSLSDFAPTAWFQQTSPTSHFTRSLVCSRATATGRVTLSDHLLIRTDEGGRSERQLSQEEVLAAYHDEFGIDLDRMPPSPIPTEPGTRPISGSLVRLEPVDAGLLEALRGDGERRADWHRDFPRDDDRDAARGCAQADGWAPRLIRRLSDGLVVGTIGFHAPPPPGPAWTAEVGFGLVAEARGQGLGSEALRLLLWLTDEIGVTLTAGITRDNLASQMMLADAGFEPGDAPADDPERELVLTRNSR